jgi:hypothetical protein
MYTNAAPVDEIKTAKEKAPFLFDSFILELPF